MSFVMRLVSIQPSSLSVQRENGMSVNTVNRRVFNEQGSEQTAWAFLLKYEFKSKATSFSLYMLAVCLEKLSSQGSVSGTSPL